MGRRGPAPQPTVLRMMRGNPGHRPVNQDEPKPPAVKPDSGLAQCPKWLTGEARNLWKRIAPDAIASGLLTVVDLPAFEALCLSYARWRELERLTGKNLDLAIAKGYRSQAVKERQLMMQFGARFGFDPSSRSNVKVAPQKPANDADAYRNRKTQQTA